MNILIAIILGIIEGLTEFLPVSSTAHLKISEYILGYQGVFADQSFRSMFDIFIQAGAVLSVIGYFWKSLFPFTPSLSTTERQTIWQTWFKTVAAFIPAAIIGFLFDKHLEYLEEDFRVIAAALFIGGVLLILIESQKREGKYTSIAELTYTTVIAIGFIQCLAMIPGTSRSAATIIGAILLGANRKTAAEFSFFLAVPTILAASGYKLLKLLTSPEFHINSEQIAVLAAGFITAMVVAWVVISVFMRYITKNDFKAFGFYRIALALVLLGMVYAS